MAVKTREVSTWSVAEIDTSTMAGSLKTVNVLGTQGIEGSIEDLGFYETALDPRTAVSNMPEVLKPQKSEDLEKSFSKQPHNRVSFSDFPTQYWGARKKQSGETFVLDRSLRNRLQSAMLLYKTTQPLLSVSETEELPKASLGIPVSVSPALRKQALHDKSGGFGRMSTGFLL